MEAADDDDSVAVSDVDGMTIGIIVLRFRSMFFDNHNPRAIPNDIAGHVSIHNTGPCDDCADGRKHFSAGSSLSARYNATPIDCRCSSGGSYRSNQRYRADTT